MPPTEEISHQPQPSSPTGHPLPRRASPESSITLRHHRLARDASYRASRIPIQPTETKPKSARRNSSDESHDTGQSDPNHWFDQSNQNPTATFDNNVMEVDPPFFQKRSESSDDKPFPYEPPRLGVPQHTMAQSSSADDYRSVIDDLTVEIQRLKEELKRYKQPGPDMLRNEKLFEIKVHGLPKKKKRELEATLRDFAANLQSSPDASSSQKKKKSSRRLGRDTGYSGSGSFSKHASSSSGSNIRPADSAYASMSTGAKSSGTSLHRPMMNSKDGNEKKVESYLRDIPEGLYPRHIIMTDKERKKIVVRRLEQLFTGKLGGRKSLQVQPEPQESKSAQVPGVFEVPLQPIFSNQQPSGEPRELAREAKILPHEQQSGQCEKKSRSRDNRSASNSRGDTTESGGNGNSTGSGPSPPMRTAPEQRPTRPRDLDPDRVQIPSENMDYIRHLGLMPPELLRGQEKVDDVMPDEEGWVYLNLLCNLAQLHIINVTPDFVRSAVSGMSTKFQLSPDGRKIRWRGGTEGTRFSSDSSGYNSQKSLSTDDSDNHNTKPHKRQKTSRTTRENIQSGSSSKNTSKFGQNQSSTESFHYKPLFAQRGDSSGGITSMDETLSSFGPAEESNMEESHWDMSGSGTSNRRKRRHDGAIIYYSAAPFCTDLSGDPGDVSPSQILSASQNTHESDHLLPPPPTRTASGSLINYHPLSDKGQVLLNDSGMDIDEDEDEGPGLTTDDTDSSSSVDLDLSWSNEKQYIQLHPLEPCGLGGVLPDDHFLVVVTTKRPKFDVDLSNRPHKYPKLEESTDGIIRRLATMSTSSPDLHATKLHIPIPTEKEPRHFEIEYVSGGIKRLAPVALPPPALFFPPFSTDESSNYDFASEDAMDTESSEELMSRRANPHQSDDYPDGVDLSSGDEEGDDPDEFPDDLNMYDIDTSGNPQALPNRGRISPPRRTSSAAAAAGTAGGGSKSPSAERMMAGDDSSAATAGGAGSEYSSSEEESD